ncbi:MAG: two-component sensor histidine kinase [Lachnospiraceae bacterium]|nr:two-component sensor histidine kinase [Lachnospiraceae bacterium]MDE6698363.1 two-component sensor histidine kinase [Lachnospiraceae bacterium]
MKSVFRRIIRSVKSIKFNLFVLIISVGILPLAALSLYIVNYYESTQIKERQDKIYSMAYMIKNLIISTDCLNSTATVTTAQSGGVATSSTGFDAVSIELEQLTGIYSGRIIIVDSNFTIIKDTYVIDEKKTCLTESVIKCFEGNEINKYDSELNNIEIALQVSGSNDAKGVIYFNFTTSDIQKKTRDINIALGEFILVVFVILIGVGIAYTFLFVKPFKQMEKEVNRIKTGKIEEELSVGGYTEIANVSNSFNHVLKRLRDIDNTRQEFVSNVSHELKTPITSIKVLADSLLNQEGIPAEMYQEFLGDIVEEIDRENQIITDLLNLVKLDKKSNDLNISSVNINEMVERVLKRLKPLAAKKNIELVLESFRPIMAEVDDVKMTMVVSNLVENAIKYNVMDGWVRVSLNADLKYFYIKIQDSGIGIPEEDQSKVFERFYRVDKARTRETGGTGLGLAITSGAVHIHNGEIKLYSVEGEGTTFTIRIPLAYAKNS